MSSDGTRVAIGAPCNDDRAVVAAATCAVYAESGGTWTQVGTDIDGEAADDQSGWSVSMSSDGTRVAIGALGRRAPAQVRVYEWSKRDVDPGGLRHRRRGCGRQVRVLSIDVLGRHARGDRRYITAANGARPRAGVRMRDSGTWTQVGSDIDGEAAGDQSGDSVSMSSDGTRVAIGCYWNDGTGTDAGHVRVYAESGGRGPRWADIDGEAAGDQSGRSVSMSSDGTRVAIGAPYNDDNGSSSGHVRVYDWNSGTSQWTQVDSDIDGEAAGDQSGGLVSMSSDGTRVAIGAKWNDGTGTSAGHARVYSLTTTTTGNEYFRAGPRRFGRWNSRCHAIILEDDGRGEAIERLDADRLGYYGILQCHNRKLYVW